MPLNIQTENGDSWITPRRFAVFLAILTFASWPGVFLGLQMFVFRDFGFFSAPIAWHLRESFWHGELPLWNPLSNCGQPFLAEWNTQALYPPVLFYLLLPFPWSLGVFCVLHLFFGGLGMFFLARHWTQSSFGAALAGVIFAFSGLMTGSLGWPSIIAALGWMPWVVWLTRRAWKEGGKILAPAAIAGALQMLSGGVEIVLLTWALLGAIFMAEFISAATPRAKIVIRFCIVILFVAGLSAAQLLPFFDLLRHSERAANYFTADSPMPPSGWVNFLVPLFRDSFAQGIYYQNGQYWILSYYTGVITVALAAMALWRRRSVEVWVMLALSIFCLVLATGNATPLYAWMSAHVGIVGLIRFPVKFVTLPVFAMPLIAAYALSGPAVETVKTSRPAYSWLLAWFATIALIGGCLVWAAREPSFNLIQAVVINGLIRVAFFTAIVISLFVLEKVTPARIRGWLQALVVVLVWLDLNCHSPQPPLVKPVIFNPNMPRPAAPPQLGFGRAIIPADVLHTLTFAAHQDATENFLTDRFAMFSDCNLYDDIPKCDGFFPLNLRGNVLLNGNLSERMQDFLGASQSLAIKGGVLEWAPRPTFMPMLTGGQKPVFATDSETLALLASTNFDPRAEVYLPLAVRSAVTVSNTATVKIISVEYSAQKITANVDAGAPAMLVTAQSYYHPWHAYVDGRPTPLWRANYAFQALEIPAGAHDIKLVYEDWNFRIGLLISAITLAIAAVFYWISVVRLRIQSSQFRIWP
ncbi:MAG TPA: YfhO family protein [Candidatus Sulfotelmatobacter sp.]|nr:YfhO family protein [Candidatus Sulfotelmatobacter sp.]